MNQLESFEKVLSDKGMKKDKGKKAKKSKKDKEKEKQEALAAAALAAAGTSGTNSSSSSPFSSLKANRSSIFSSSTGRQSTSTAFDDDPHRRQSTVSQGDESTSLSHRHSFQSSRSTVILGGEQVQVQQAKKRWWNPKRKETTSMYSVSDTFSVSETDQERYLSTLLQNHQDQQRQVSGELSQTISVQLPANDTEREDALAALLENSKTIMSLPIPTVFSPTSSVINSQQIQSSPPIGTVDSNELAPAVATTPEPTPVADSTERQATTPTKEHQVTPAATTPTPAKVKAAKSNKPKLLPISTPLAQILEISNPEELWQYVQQAKTYATTRMNKGDKRSAAIALKRAQALEARWQEILLEMASSDEEDDELLDDDDDEDEDDSDEEDAPAEVTPSIAPAALPVAPPVAAAVSTPATSAPPAPTESDGEDEGRNRILRPPTSRSDSAPDMYSKYKVSNKPPPAPMDESNPTVEPAEESKDSCTSGDDGRLGPEATLDEMQASTNKDHLQFYIQRLKTDTVATARKGNKYAALQGMKDVKVLQQRLSELEEQEEQEEKSEATETTS